MNEPLDITASVRLTLQDVHIAHSAAGLRARQHRTTNRKKARKQSFQEAWFNTYHGSIAELRFARYLDLIYPGPTGCNAHREVIRSLKRGPRAWDMVGPGGEKVDVKMTLLQVEGPPNDWTLQRFSLRPFCEIDPDVVYVQLALSAHEFERTWLIGCATGAQLIESGGEIAWNDLHPLHSNLGANPPSRVVG